MEDIALNSQKEVLTVWQNQNWKIWSHNYITINNVIVKYKVTTGRYEVITTLKM